jgi:hypothetical protein
MRNSKLKSLLQVIAILSVVASLLLCLNGCKKKKPEPTESTPSTESIETTGAEDTAPTTKPTTPAPTTKPTTPPPTTMPAETTEPVNNCAHVLGNWKVGQVSNCTTEGSRYKECTLCKEKVETEVIPKTDHSASNWIVDKKATCTSQGKQHQECTQCKEVLISIVVGVADHNTKTMSGYAATTSTPGRTDSLHCKTCDAEVQKSFVIPIIGSVKYTYEVNSDGKSCTITGATDFSAKELILPAAIDGYTVTALGEKAFASKTSITTLYIPKTVTKLGSKAFTGCYSLTNITYQGTSTQWNTVVKGTEWNSGTGHYTIYCTNTGLSK